MNDFYVGYLPKAPTALASFVRKVIVVLGLLAVTAACNGLPMPDGFRRAKMTVCASTARTDTGKSFAKPWKIASSGG